MFGAAHAGVTMPDITPVQTPKQIAQVAGLVRDIWTDHYTPIIGHTQVDYMLNKFQSQQAIATQISDGYEYYLTLHNQKPAAYLALLPDTDDATCLISKIYVSRAARNLGLGRALLNFTENLCRQRQLHTLWLTVNKQNATAINWYTRKGFINIGPILQDIGGGFVMDDYRMEKRVD